MRNLRFCLLMGMFLLPASSFLDAGETVLKQGQIKAKLEVEYQYLESLPEGYEDQEKWPLVLFLHGAGERGDNLEKLKIHGPPMQASQGRKFPFIMIAPQCPAEKWWFPNELSLFLDQIEKQYKVDPDRIYVTGLSMGGYGTWALASYDPKRFAAIVPICGGGIPSYTKYFPHLPVWAFHGDQDSVVPLYKSEEMIEALKKNGGDGRLTVYEGVQHNSWTATYDNPEVYKWMLKQRRKQK